MECGETAARWECCNHRSNVAISSPVQAGPGPSTCAEGTNYVITVDGGVTSVAFTNGGVSCVFDYAVTSFEFVVGGGGGGGRGNGSSGFGNSHAGFGGSGGTGTVVIRYVTPGVVDPLVPGDGFEDGIDLLWRQRGQLPNTR